MRQFFAVIMIIFLSLSSISNDACARRFGGGRMFNTPHKSSFSNLFNKKNTSYKQKNARTIGSGGFLRGLLIGGLLASLFFGNGLAPALLAWMLVSIIILLIVTYFHRKKHPYNNRHV